MIINLIVAFGATSIIMLGPMLLELAFATVMYAVYRYNGGKMKFSKYLDKF